MRHESSPGSLFVWGRIEHLVPYALNLAEGPDSVIETLATRNLIAEPPGPRLVIHMDKKSTISDAIWEQVRQSATSRRSDMEKAATSLSKADVLVFPVSVNAIFGLSVKAGTGASEVKLSQQSAPHVYKFHPKAFTLVGGKNMKALKDAEVLVRGISASAVAYENTSLTEEQFDKLSRGDRIFAVIKHRYPGKWKDIVRQAMEEANENLTEFGKALSGRGATAQHNLRELMAERLVGDWHSAGNYEMWISGMKEPVNLSKVLQDQRRFPAVSELSCRARPSTNGKVSLVIYAVTVSGGQYVVCKIEPSFDGGEAQVSQTKGIVYYFQEGRQLDLPTVWDLIEFLWTGKP